VVVAENRGLSASFSSSTQKLLQEQVLAHKQQDGSFGSLQNTMHAIGALSLLTSNKEASKLFDSSKACSAAKALLTSSSTSDLSVEQVFQATSIASRLTCLSGVTVSKAVTDLLRSSIDDNKSVESVHYATLAVISLSKAKALTAFSPKDIHNVLGNLAEAVGSEEISLESAGLAFLTVARLSAASPAKSDDDKTAIDVVTDAVADVLSRGVELDDGSVVFYDAGDSNSAARVTDALLSGVIALASANPDLSLPDVCCSNQSTTTTKPNQTKPYTAFCIHPSIHCSLMLWAFVHWVGIVGFGLLCW
jgi:hypothetical protein